jgi:MoaA/NifB/PqqE/SkfB family radical SAM enzyme
MLENRNHYLTGLRFKFYQAGVLLRACQIALQSYPNWRNAAAAVRGLLEKNSTNNRFRNLTKAVVVGGRAFSMMSVSGKPSPGLDTMLRNELHRSVPIPGFTKGMLLLFLAITKKCSMQCAHCFEWEALNEKEVLSVEDILLVVRKFQARGLANVELGGGEPLNRFRDLLEILQKSDTRQSDFWVSSSGYRLDAERAKQLKAAGLTGISISLDHWDAAAHDQFRGLPGAFDWAIHAAKNARDAGFVVGLTLVPTRAFCSRENFWRYLDLAKSLQVHFVRILEPRAVGHFAESEEAVELSEKHWMVLEDFHREIQNGHAFRDFPIVEYHGTFNRHAGCGGAGERYLYVDTDGDFHACPFCRNKCGSAVNGSVEDGLLALKQASGCHAYHLV